MIIYPLQRPRYFVWVLMFAWLLESCTGEVIERDCRQVQQEITTFTKQNILPLVDSESPPKIQRSTVEQLKQLRKEVDTCALPDAANSATEWNEANFIRLYGRLAYFEVMLERAAEEDDPEVIGMLVNSRSFGEMVLELQAALGLEHPQ